MQNFNRYSEMHRTARDSILFAVYFIPTDVFGLIYRVSNRELFPFIYFTLVHYRD